MVRSYVPDDASYSLKKPDFVAALVAIVVVASSVVGLGNGARVSAATESPSAVSGEFLVEATPSEAAAAGFNVVDDVGFGWVLVDEADRSTDAAQLSVSSGFDVIPNYVYEIFTDPLFSNQWSMENTGQSGGTVDADIDILDAWDVTMGVSDVVVAVLDTGVDMTHSDLSPVLWKNAGEVVNGVDDDGNGYVDDVDGWDAVAGSPSISDTHGHGTFVSSNVAAALNGVGMVGVAPGVRIMPVRVCNNSSCPSSAIIGGLAYVLATGADVVNLSLGGTGFSTATRDALLSLAADGVSVVVAAGNTSQAPNPNNDVVPIYPASYDVPGLIAVAATDRNDNLASFSHYGLTKVDLAAPGATVYGASAGGGWVTGSGTSFSSPKTAGAAALVRSVLPNSSPDDIKEILMDSVDVKPTLVGKTVTGGRLNVGEALQLALKPTAVGSVDPMDGILPFTAQFDGSGSSDIDGTVVSWSWALPDGSVVNNAIATWSPNKPGSYEATLTVTDNDGLLDTVTVSFSAALRPGGTFIDDNGHFAEGAIEAIYAEGVTKGCNPPANDMFCPEGEVTRGQMAAFLARALDLPETAIDFFVDDNSSVFEPAINRLAAAGVTKGCNPPANTNYCSDQIVTRGQMAAFIARAFDLPVGAVVDVFTDDDGHIFEVSIDKIWNTGITSGCNPPTNDHYCPDSPVKRGQMAVFIMKALGLSPIIPPPPA